MTEQMLRDELIELIETMTGVFNGGLGGMTTKMMFAVAYYLATGDCASAMNKRMSLMIQRKLSTIHIHV